MDALDQLHGACACERNQYTIVIPHSGRQQAQVYFDNSAANRRAQATPVTAWLRVPLDWYQSATFAQFPDETHASIKRTFYTDATAAAAARPTRRQFCGYCGTHLTAWNEATHGDGAAAVLDVTLGSLLSESLERLEALRLVPGLDNDDDDDKGNDDDEDTADRSDGRVREGGAIDDEDHVPTNEQQVGGVDGPAGAPRAATLHRMHGRGVPYFEAMVENSRLGRIKRQVGGHTSRDGRTQVHWEVVEIGGGGGADEPMTDVLEPGGGDGGGGSRTKRQKHSH